MVREELIAELTLRSISSIDFIIKTKAIHELENQIMSWLTTSTCGAIIYGRARIGKTRAMMCIANSIREKYGETFPVISWDITDHAITEKNFYTSILMAIGLKQIPERSTALALKERVLNELSMEAYKTPFKKVVIMIDEAWKLTEKDFSWLMDLYNNLNRKDILMTCFLFGTHELKDRKTSLKLLGQNQIIGRFMINEFMFFGMQEPNELMLCLIAFDNMTITDESGKKAILVSDYFFPDRGNMKFINFIDIYWKAFMAVKAECAIKNNDIPMKYLIDSFIILLKKYGALSDNRVAFPTYNELLDCVRLSGYGESDDAEAEVTKPRKKRSA